MARQVPKLSLGGTLADKDRNTKGELKQNAKPPAAPAAAPAAAASSSTAAHHPRPASAPKRKSSRRPGSSKENAQKVRPATAAAHAACSAAWSSAAGQRGASPRRTMSAPAGSALPDAGASLVAFKRRQGGGAGGKPTGTARSRRERQKMCLPGNPRNKEFISPEARRRLENRIGEPDELAQPKRTLTEQLQQRWDKDGEAMWYGTDASGRRSPAQKGLWDDENNRWISPFKRKPPPKAVPPTAAEMEALAAGVIQQRWAEHAVPMPKWQRHAMDPSAGLGARHGKSTTAQRTAIGEHQRGGGQTDDIVRRLPMSDEGRGDSGDEEPAPRRPPPVKIRTESGYAGEPKEELPNGWREAVRGGQVAYVHVTGLTLRSVRAVSLFEKMQARGESPAGALRARAASFENATARALGGVGDSFRRDSDADASPQLRRPSATSPSKGAYGQNLGASSAALLFERIHGYVPSPEGHRRRRRSSSTAGGAGGSRDGQSSSLGTAEPDTKEAALEGEMAIATAQAAERGATAAQWREKVNDQMRQQQERSATAVPAGDGGGGRLQAFDKDPSAQPRRTHSQPGGTRQIADFVSNGIMRGGLGWR